MVGLEPEARLVRVLFAQAVELLDRRDTVRAVLPLAGCPPLELGRFGRLAQRFASLEQCADVDTIIASRLIHPFSPYVLIVVLWLHPRVRASGPFSII